MLGSSAVPEGLRADTDVIDLTKPKKLPYHEVFLRRAFPGSRAVDELKIPISDIGTHNFHNEAPGTDIHGETRCLATVDEVLLVDVEAEHPRITYMVAPETTETVRKSRFELYSETGRKLLKFFGISR